MSLPSKEVCAHTWNDQSFDQIKLKIETNCKSKDILNLHKGYQEYFSIGENQFQYLAIHICRFDREILTSIDGLFCEIK